MATVLYTDYRIEGQPFAISEGWSARGQVWSVRTGTALGHAPLRPIHLPSPSQEVARTSASCLKRLV
jgi:hypothetical protein